MTARGPFAIVAIAFHAVLLPLPALAQTDVVPSAVAPVQPSTPFISRQTATVAGLLLGAALFGDGKVRHEAQEHRSTTSNSLASVGNSLGEWTLVVPALGAGYLAGEIAGSSDFKRVMLHAGAAAALATGISSGLKYSIGRMRPDIAGGPAQFRPFSGSNSFPSGHTAVAFALATSIADETDDSWSDYAVYGAATLTAMSRINDNRHWASDVLVGALIGHLSARWITRQMGPVSVSPVGVSVNLNF
jgi:membrane-associated phospholipid phosphatase